MLEESFLDAKHDLSPRTLEQYSRALDFLGRECPKLPKRPESIRSALSKLESVWTRDAYWRVWKAFFQWCWWEYQIPNPMERVQRPKLPEIEPRFLGCEELAQVVAAADNIRDKVIVALALDSGIRASEFGRLKVLDIGEDTIWVWGKGRKRIRVPISPEARHLLQTMIDSDGYSGPQSLLFPSQNGRPLSRFATYRIVRGCMDRAGIAGPKRGAHCLRHSLATNFLANGGDLSTLQKIMRHNNIATTMKYVHTDMSTVIKQHHQYSPGREAIRGAQGVLIKREVEEILQRK